MLNKDATSAEFDAWMVEILCRAEKEARVEERRAARLRAVFDAVVDHNHDSCLERQEERDWHHALACASSIRERAQQKNTKGDGGDVLLETNGCQGK